MKSNNETKGAARQHSSYSALCILPDGATVTRAAAEAQGFAVLTVGLAAQPPETTARPLPPPLAPTTPRSASPPVPAAVVADRERAAALITMTAKGVEAEAECREAIRSGASVEEYRATVAARSILEALNASRGT